MTRALQKKFTVTAMIAVTVLLAVLLGLLNGFNGWSTAQQTTRLAAVLLRTEGQQSGLPPDGQIPDGGPRPDRPDGAQPPEGLPEDRELSELMDGRGLFLEPLTENDTRAALYFLVRFSADGAAAADVSRLSGVSEDEAVALAQPLFAAGRTEGRQEGYRYAASSTPEGETVYVFLDVSAQIGDVVRVALLSLLLGAAAWGLMLLLVALLSKRAIRPIAENMEKQRRFVTDAGHEIKTPLAIIQANTEAMELRTGENKYTKNIRDQVSRLGGLMQDLLTLAKADESRTAETATLLSLSEIVAAAAESFQAPMELRGLSLDAELAPELSLRGDRTLLTRLVSILMDNAVKYASENSALRLSLKKTDRWAVLSLSNSCDALPDCPPEKLFDRFYRADEARTQRTGGYGIGLSAARAIAEAHKGSIHAAYEGSTITFTVKLPVK